jgi:hypothetical protein
MYSILKQQENMYVIYSDASGIIDLDDIELIFMLLDIDDSEDLYEKYSIINADEHDLKELIAFRTEQLARKFIEDFLNPLQTLIDLTRNK